METKYPGNCNILFLVFFNDNSGRWAEISPCQESEKAKRLTN